MERSALADPRILVGSWRFTRRIDDRLSHQASHAEGTATLELTDERTIAWHESGLLDWNGSELPVQRTLLITRMESGEWDVLFADGAPFHTWRVDESFTHPCKADRYDGRLHETVDDPRSWSIEWTVSGPAKDYTLTTLYEKSGLRADA